MIISENWLREWVPSAPSTQELVECLTMAGIEIGSVAPVSVKLAHVVVGEITALEAHPDADQLRVCNVRVGKSKRLTIVCGAPNAAVGMKAPVALPGATLPNGVEIKEAAVRGVASAGMLCSAEELGLGESAEGLLALDADAEPGTALFDYLHLKDNQIEVELTPNRGDCLSIAGLARELAAVIGSKVRPAKFKPVAVKKAATRLSVKLTAKQDCPRYVGQAITGIRMDAVTPVWIKERLRRSGIRSIHPVVDVTNYVMLELGQPMHAFDLDKLQGGIDVRVAGPREGLLLLDGSQAELVPGSLVIADRVQALALAGVMGGQASAVSAGTINIFLESAFFRPEAIALSARRHGLHTDSSHRFERGVDPALQRHALDRAAALLVQIVGGTPGPVQEVTNKATLPKRVPIVLRRQRLADLLGVDVPAAKVKTLLTRLQMQVTGTTAGWRAVPPSFRFDLAREVDLIEEVARLYGYAALPSAMPLLAMGPGHARQTEIPETRVRHVLVDRDYQEVITYSFVDPALQQELEPGVQPAVIKNPIASNMAVMRTTLWAGLLETVVYNKHRQQARIRVFELGRRFARHGDRVIQDWKLAGAAVGPALPEQWGRKATPVDFYDIKGDVEALLVLTGRPFRFVPAEHPALHPGQTAAVLAEDGQRIGLVGALHPRLQTRLGIDDAIFLFELDLASICQATSPILQELSKFPSIRRDLAVVLPRTVPAQAILDTVSKVAGKLLVNLELFDDYRGEGIDSGSKSLAMGLTLQDSSRTLKEEVVDALMANVVSALGQEHGAQLRQ